MYVKNQALCRTEAEPMEKDSKFKEIPCLSEAVFNFINKSKKEVSLDEISEGIGAEPKRIKVKLHQLKFQRFIILTEQKNWKVNENLK